MLARRGNGNQLVPMGRPFDLFDVFKSDPFFGMLNSRFNDEEIGVFGDVDLYEKDGFFNLSMNVPGIKPEEMSIEMESDGMNISWESKQETNENENNDGKRWIMKKRSYSSFSRRIPFPAKINPDSVKASYANGMLEIKAEIANKPNKVKIVLENNDTKKLED